MNTFRAFVLWSALLLGLCGLSSHSALAETHAREESAATDVVVPRRNQALPDLKIGLSGSLSWNKEEKLILTTGAGKSYVVGIPKGQEKTLRKAHALVGKTVEVEGVLRQTSDGALVVVEQLGFKLPQAYELYLPRGSVAQSELARILRSSNEEFPEAALRIVPDSDRSSYHVTVRTDLSETQALALLRELGGTRIGSIRPVRMD